MRKLDLTAHRWNQQTKTSMTASTQDNASDRSNASLTSEEKTSSWTSLHRNPSFDVLKALLILWVVWGHLQSTGLVEPSHSFLEGLLWRSKVANMPAFFVISGFLAYSTFQNGSWAKILARITSFAWPRATFAILFLMVELLLADTFVHRLGPWKLFLYIYRSRWFLRTLGSLYFLSAIIYRNSRTDVRRWLSFGTVYAILLFLPASARHHVLRLSGGDQLVHMFPYFVFGLMILRRRKLWQNRAVALTCTAFFGFIILQPDLCNVIGLSTWKAKISWDHLFLEDWELLRLALRTALGLSGTICLMGCVERILRILPGLSRLATYGTTTMGIYIIHERPFEILVSLGFPFIPLPSWTRFVLAVACFIVCHSAVLSIRKIRMLNQLFFGNEKRLESFLLRLFSLTHQSSVDTRSPIKRQTVQAMVNDCHGAKNES